jgi:hypothetical protein
MNELLSKIKKWSALWNRLDFQLPTLKIEQLSEDKYTLLDARNIDQPKDEIEIDHERAKMLLVASIYKNTKAHKWALDNSLGIVRNEWFIPLATAEPDLILAMEKECVRAAEMVN